MIEAVSILPAALFAISGVLVMVLALSWWEFGRPRHALSWAVAFALFGSGWGVRLFASASIGPDRSLAALLCLSLWALAFNTLGFRQRAAMPERRNILFVAATACALVMIANMTADAARALWLTPFAVCVAGMCLFAAAGLSGRRASERAVARIAYYGLIAMASVALAIAAGTIAEDIGVITLDMARLATLMLLVLPGAVTASGLFAVLLLAADLADRTRRLAATDMLTGLLNRRGLEAAMPAVLESARLKGRAMVLALIDIDHFKAINDRFGHPGGDTVLRAFADCLRATLARRDLLARIGGEEFAIVMTDIDRRAATAATDRLREAFKRCAIALERDFCVTASFGLTELCADDADLAGILVRADMALYRSKGAGRNCATWAP